MEGGSRGGRYRVVLKVLVSGVVRIFVGFGVRLLAHPKIFLAPVRFRNSSA